MTLFINATEQETKNILYYSAKDLSNEDKCAFILTDIGTSFGIYYDEIMDYTFSFNYKKKDNDYDYTNLFLNKLYRISQYNYRFYYDLEFNSKTEYQIYINSCAFI